MQRKKGMKRVSKVIMIAQLVLIVGVICFVLFFVPYLDYPLDGSVLEQKNVEFKFRNANVILFDDNEDFSSAVEIDFDDINFSKILFKPGTYYWKAVGIFESEPRVFSVSSDVGLELDRENRVLKNVGNSVLDVDVENEYGITGFAVLGVDSEYLVNLDDEIIYRGEQYEE